MVNIRQIPGQEFSDDQVLVRVRAASVNAFDYGLVRGGRLVSVLAKQPHLDK